MAPAGSVWDHKSDKDLLLTIIDEGSLKWPTISDKMIAKGYTFTKEACRQHFQKIRKEARNGGGSDGGTSPTRNPAYKVQKTKGSAKSTPQKSKSMTDSFSTNNGFYAVSNGLDDDDEEMTTPLKRKRIEKTEGLEYDGRSAPLFKQEHIGGQGAPIDLEHEDLYSGQYA